MHDTGSAAQAKASGITFPNMGIPASLSIYEAPTTIVQQMAHRQHANPRLPCTELSLSDTQVGNSLHGMKVAHHFLHRAPYSSPKHRTLIG